MCIARRTYTCVNEFAKTDQIVTRTEIQLWLNIVATLTQTHQVHS